jgi:branched-chain amino acid transport system ATP-binding protein
MSTGEVLLRGREISRRWGGLVAVNKVSLDVRRGEVHAVIGTNGAGKSTLINILSGEIPPSEGQVELLGQDVTRWPQPKRAQAGLGRSYQRTTIYASFTVLENCRLAAQARAQKPWTWWQDASRCNASVKAAREAAQRTGLTEFLDRPAGLLSHGQKRQLEIAMCLATAPQVLLLDEPLAGMGAEETERARYGRGVSRGRSHYRHGQRRGDCLRRARSRAQQRAGARRVFGAPLTWPRAPSFSKRATSTPGTAQATSCTVWI